MTYLKQTLGNLLSHPSGTHFLTFALEALCDSDCFISLGTKSQISMRDQYRFSITKDFFTDHRTIVATKVSRKHYLVPKDGGEFSADEFEEHPERYRSIFAEKVSLLVIIIIVQKMKFFIKDFFRKLRIWSHLLKKSLMQNFIFVQCILCRVLYCKFSAYTLLGDWINDSIKIFILYNTLPNHLQFD